MRAALLAALLATLSAVSFEAVRVRAAAIESSPDDADVLAGHKLLIPVEGVKRAGLRDNFDEGRPGHRHEALDILAPRGTPVIAAGDGRVAKLFRSLAGGITVYQFDSDERFVYYYAHLDHYRKGISEGDALEQGDTIGFVGTTGNAPPDIPHLHFQVMLMPDDGKWWTGIPVNPRPLFVE